jgi:hypothetical protein
MTLASEFARKPECLRLHAPWDGDAVWAHHRHAQHDTPPYAVTAETVAPLAEGVSIPGRSASWAGRDATATAHAG